MREVAILGGSGYTGSELLHILLKHPYVQVKAVTSERLSGSFIAETFPEFGSIDLKFEPLHIKAVSKKADIFFLCLPHKTSQKIVAFLYDSGKKIIDLSADYRFRSASVYKKWYATPHLYSNLLKKAVYGIPELYRDKIRNASIIANPGCYPVSAILGLSPIISEKIIDLDSIIIDSKSGASGAGRSPSQPLMFCEVNESVRAYAVTVHRHTPEIEQELSSRAGKNLTILFTPHLMPMDRGILSTMYVRLKKSISLSSVFDLYRDFYRSEPFVRILRKGTYPSTKAVRGTNFCDISLFLNTRSRKEQNLIVISAIDNLMKGASGSAVHNMNIMCGFDETTGLLCPSIPSG